MSVSSARISMHQPTYSLTVGSIPSAVIGGFIYRLVGNQIAESGRLRSASVIRATPCRSAGYGTGSGGVTRIVRAKLPVSFRRSFPPASGGHRFALGSIGRHAADALRA